MVDDAVIAALADIKVGIAEIASDLKAVNKRLERNEGYTHHVNKRLLNAEKGLSWIKGAFYFLIASGIITLCSVAAQRVILSR